MIKNLFLFICLSIFIGSCSRASEPAVATIAVAANFKTTLDALETEFEAQTGYDLQIVVGSTGKLFAQITHGAPYDVFLSADQVRPIRLVEDGLAMADTRMTYAIGRLVVLGVEDIDDLSSSEVSRIAIANPDLAPYGRAAAQTIEALGLDDALAPKLVLGENVGQAFAFVSTENAQAGFVSEAQVLTLTSAQQTPVLRIDPDLHDPIAQDAVLLARAKDNPIAKAFLAFLQSPEARDLIARHGYDLSE